MKRKRIISILAAAVMTFCLAGCQLNNSGAGQAEQTSGESLQFTAAQTEQTTEQTSSESLQTVSETEITDRSEENNNLIVPVNKKLIKFEDGNIYGFKDTDGNIIVPAGYPIANYFRNEDMTGMAVKIKNELYYIDKDGNVFLETNDIPFLYTDFYNGYAYFDNRFIDENGNTVCKYDNVSVDICYWGNGYFEDYYHPSYNGIGYTGHSCFIDVHGNEKVSTADVRVSELIDGYAVINGGGWSVIVDGDLKVKAVFLNTISVMPNYVMTSVVYNYDFDERKYLLKIIKGYRPVTEPYDSDDIDEIKRIFKDDYDPEKVPVYIYDGDRTEIYLEDWNKYDVEYDYEIVDVQSIIGNEKSPVQGVSEKNTGTGEADIVYECINDLKSRYGLPVVDHMLYDIDGDNNDELLILSEGALLYNCRELHVYRIDDKGFRYCGSIKTLLQRELYDDIADRNSDPMSYNKLDIKKFSYGETNYNCVFTSSVRTSFRQTNYVSAVAFDEEDMITEIPLLMWGINIPAGYRGEELIPEYYFYNEGVPKKVTYEDVRYYLSLLEDTSDSDDIDISEVTQDANVKKTAKMSDKALLEKYIFYIKKEQKELLKEGSKCKICLQDIYGDNTPEMSICILHENGYTSEYFFTIGENDDVIYMGGVTPSNDRKLYSDGHSNFIILSGFINEEYNDVQFSLIYKLDKEIPMKMVIIPDLAEYSNSSADEFIQKTQMFFIRYDKYFDADNDIPAEICAEDFYYDDTEKYEAYMLSPDILALTDSELSEYIHPYNTITHELYRVKRDEYFSVKDKLNNMMTESDIIPEIDSGWIEIKDIYKWLSGV